MRDDQVRIQFCDFLRDLVIWGWLALPDTDNGGSHGRNNNRAANEMLR
jgi:hypothetical protein